MVSPDGTHAYQTTETFNSATSRYDTTYVSVINTTTNTVTPLRPISGTAQGDLGVVVSPDGTRVAGSAATDPTDTGPP